MTRTCSIHNHTDYPVINRQLTLGMISPAKAGQALGVGEDMIKYHMKQCTGESEMLLDDTKGFDPYQKLLKLTQRLFTKAEEMLDAGDLQHGSEKVTGLIREATNAISKLHAMGRTFVPVSEKQLQLIKDDYQDLENWLYTGLCMECRIAFDKFLSRGEEEYGEELGLITDTTEDP